MIQYFRLAVVPITQAEYDDRVLDARGVTGCVFIDETMLNRLPEGRRQKAIASEAGAMARALAERVADDEPPIFWTSATAEIAAIMTLACAEYRS